MKEKLFKQLAIIVSFIFAVNLLAMKFYWYYTIWWFDMPMHFSGGFFIGLLSLTVYISYFLKKNREFDPKSIILISFLSALIVGVLWELFEFSLDTFINFRLQDIWDTLSDISFDLAGSLVAGLYFLRYNKKHE